MLATATIALLFLEIFVFGVIGFSLAIRFNWPSWSAGLFIIPAILASWLLVVMRMFILSSRYTTETATTRRLGIANWLKMICTEWLQQMLIFHVLMPFHKRFNCPDPPLSAKGAPVLLVHGLACNGAVWWWMRRALAKRGVDRCYMIDLEPVLGDIDDYARQLAQRVEEICAETGWSKIVLVTHSMGGLAARSYLHKLDGAYRVAGLVTLGTPHHGTALATIPVGENLRQMQLNNAWIAQLNHDESQAAPAPIRSIYSAHDNLVSPQASSRLQYAENIRLAGIGHVGLAFSEEAADITAEFIKRCS